MFFSKFEIRNPGAMMGNERVGKGRARLPETLKGGAPYHLLLKPASHRGSSKLISRYFISDSEMEYATDKIFKALRPG